MVVKNFVTVYIKRIPGIRPLTLLLCLLFAFTTSHAQNEGESAPVAIDTVLADEEIADADSAVSVVEENNKVYFLPKYQMYYGVVDSFKFYHLRPGTVSSLKQEEDFWYADLNFNKNKPKPTYKQQSNSRPIGQHPAFQTLLWILSIGGFIAFLVIYLMNSNVKLFRGSATIKYDAEEELLTDDIFGISYEKEIAKASAAGNYRLAVRLLFLRMLRNLSNKSIIDYKQDRTNFDYLLQLQKSSYFKDFFQLTRNYEYSWYGQFPVSEDKYEVIKKEFDEFDQKLNY